MELTMISLKVLGAAAVMALLLPVMSPGESFAQDSRLAARQGGGAARQSGGGNFAARQSGGSGLVARQGGGAPGQRFSGGGGYRGGYNGGYRRDGRGGFIPGAVAGAVVGGAIASQGYYGGPGYYAPGYSNDQYFDDSAAVAAGPPGDDAVAYCMQTYRSYDPQSGTYLGFDGQQHPCP
jgi:hypothetical protein